MGIAEGGGFGWLVVWGRLLAGLWLVGWEAWGGVGSGGWPWSRGGGFAGWR